MGRGRWMLLCVAVTLLLGCNGAEDLDTPAARVEPTETVKLIARACAAGEMLLDDGSCRAAGIPLDACGEGFAPDGRGGCEANLPPEPCPEGLMAIPGESVCREIAPCGEGTWGDIPVEPDTEYVDGAYTGDHSDGSKERPWRTIRDGLRHAVRGAIVAVAAGSYAESMIIEHRPIRLWGRCPRLVEVVGSGLWDATVHVRGGADGTEIRGLAVQRGLAGVVVWNARDVTVDRVWIHDTRGVGVGAVDDYGPASFEVHGSLIEDTAEPGIDCWGCGAKIEATVLRDAGDRAIGAINSASTSARARVAVRSSVIERAHHMGVYAFGSNLSLDTSVVRDTIARDTPLSGRGVVIVDDRQTGTRAEATIRSSVVSHNHDAGISVVASDLLVETTVVRDTQPAPRMNVPYSSGVGIAVADAEHSAERTFADLRSVLVEGNHDVGIFVVGGTARVESTVVRGTLPVNDVDTGKGIWVQNGLPPARKRARLSLVSSIVEQNRSAGVLINGATAILDATVVRDTAPISEGRLSVGVVIQNGFADAERADALIHDSVIERNAYAGLVVEGSDATMVRAIVRESQPRLDGTRGWGVAVQHSTRSRQPARATLRSCTIEGNHELGIFIGDARVTIEDTRVLDTLPGGSQMGGTGILVQSNPSIEAPRDALIRGCTLEGNSRTGITILNSNATIEGTSVSRTLKEAARHAYGDGIAVVSTLALATARIADCRVRRNERAGVSSYGAAVQVERSIIEDNVFDIHDESYDGFPPALHVDESVTCSNAGVRRKCQDKMADGLVLPPSPVDPFPAFD